MFKKYLLNQLTVIICLTFICDITNEPILPQPNAQAVICISGLTDSGDMDNCHSVGLKKWDQNKNINESGSQSWCCTIWDESDCIIRSIHSKCTNATNKAAALTYQQNLIKYWNSSSACNNAYRYNSTLCKSANRAYPMPTANAAMCIKRLKVISALDTCHNVSMKKWSPDKVKLPQNQEWCCSIWDEIDCILNDVDQCPNLVNRQEAVIHQKNVIDYWNSTYCNNDYTYHSRYCKSVFPEPNGNAATCLSLLKTNKLLDMCHNASFTKWNLFNKKDITEKETCYSTWDEIDCITQALNTCPDQVNRQEAQHYQQYLIDYWSNSICTNYSYVSHALKSFSICLVSDLVLLTFSLFIITIL